MIVSNAKRKLISILAVMGSRKGVEDISDLKLKKLFQKDIKLDTNTPYRNSSQKMQKNYLVQNKFSVSSIAKINKIYIITGSLVFDNCL